MVEFLTSKCRALGPNSIPPNKNAKTTVPLYNILFSFKTVLHMADLEHVLAQKTENGAQILGL
jgi:hypothetical protein